MILERDVARLVVPAVGKLVGPLDGESEPYELVDATGAVVAPVSAFFRELTASGRPMATLRSYGMDLLRWWRFLAAMPIGRARVSRFPEARRLLP